MLEGDGEKGGPLPGPRVLAAAPSAGTSWGTQTRGCFFGTLRPGRHAVLAQAAAEFTPPFAASIDGGSDGCAAPLVCALLPLATRLLTEATDGPSVRYEVASNREGYSDDLPLGLQRIV